MASDLKLTVMVNRIEAASGKYPVQLWHEGAPVAKADILINRQLLLLHEHAYSARDYGLELYKALFTDPLGSMYQQLVGTVGAEATIHVRVVIDSDAHELHVLPWERLFHQFKGMAAPLATSAQTPFSRFLMSGAGEQSSVSALPLHLLVAIANPTQLPADLATLDVVGEVQALADLLADLPGKVRGTVLPGRSGLPDALQKRLTQEGWTIADGVTSRQNIQRHLQDGQQILHILAHGQLANDGTAYLLLEDEGSDKVARGSMARVSDQEIVDGLAGIQPLPQLIFLAACESAKRPANNPNPFVGLAPKLVEKGVPAVVAMQDLVPIDLAHTLTFDFYRRLFDHGQVDRALNEARSLLFKANQFEWAIPVLFLRLQNGQLFSTMPVKPRKPFEPSMVFVRGGPFLMGSQPADGVPAAETPQHSVTLGDYYIGKYPVTNRQYAEFIKQVKSQDVSWFNRKPPADRLDYPVTGVSWHDAVAYCVWLSCVTDRGYRLPTEAEWEKAARGADGRRYPWGEDWGEQHANVGSQATTAVTAHPLGASPYGCEDMIGNVEEWTRTLWGSQWALPDFGYPHDENDGRTVATSADLPVQGKVVQRGGSYRSQAEELSCARRNPADPDSKLCWRGFRVVMEV